MNDIKFIGELISHNVKESTITLKVDFLDPDRLDIIEHLLVSKQSFSFWFKKPYRKLKTWKQLKKYFALLNTILCNATETDKPSKDEVRAFDNLVKESALYCKVLELFGNELPIPPSKADMSVEELNILIAWLMETYSEYLEDGDVL